LRRWSVAAVCAAVVLGFAGVAAAQIKQSKSNFEDKFRQLDQDWPTPNDQRLASGAPGPGYWQQRADYTIAVTLDDANQSIKGSETITYTNNSPHRLTYLWVRLDQNRFAKHSDDYLSMPAASSKRMRFRDLRHEYYRQKFDGGFKISELTDGRGRKLDRSIVGTMMRIDLPKPLEPGEKFVFRIGWSYKLIESRAVPIKRSGFDYFRKDGNYLYNMGQWYPRVAAYTDAEAWDNRTFFGLGEFLLEFGDFDVAITVPADHIVAATGTLQNAAQVLSAAQRSRLKKARNAKKPVFIVTRDEALANQAEKDTSRTKTWKFRAENVRDFAFASSRKFVWDAMGYHQKSDGRTIMAQSFYPEEGMPLWDKYSTEAIVHTLKTYSKYTFPYPYPVAQSINSATSGMEYPMVSFNPPRPTEGKDGKRTYSRRTKYGLLSVIIHEVGHNYFPMVVSTPERDWFWMDEGFNTFLQSMAQRAWEKDFPGSLGAPSSVVDYMLSKNQVPVMTDPESLLQFGNNAYRKPATAFNILRETVMGHEAFDHAFREYARRWKFRHPYPADFFRTMEDASGFDLDWFWRGWFYTTDHVDISIDRVVEASIDTKDPDIEAAWARRKEATAPVPRIVESRKDLVRRIDENPDLVDFYNRNDAHTVSDRQRKKYAKTLEGLEDWQKELLKSGDTLYFIELSNVGGLVMPVILEIVFEDGSREEVRWQASLWRRNPFKVRKLYTSARKIRSITLDPHLETADADLENNYWPRRPVKTRLELFKARKSRNLMKEMQEPETPKEDSPK